MSVSLGLKVWSVNKNYIEPARRLYNLGVFSYIEISALPGTLETAEEWKKLPAPYIVHAPHFMHGLNFSSREKAAFNGPMAEEALRFADKLKASHVIFHPGVGGDFRETARQIKKLKDSRVLVENKPYAIEKGGGAACSENICVGYSPEQIEYILQEGETGFCLDIGHAFCAANALKNDKFSFLKEFLKLKPVIFHISDGEAEGLYDRHYNIGRGSYDFEAIFRELPKEISITVETEKNSPVDLDDFALDAEKLKQTALSSRLSA